MSATTKPGAVPFLFTCSICSRQEQRPTDHVPEGWLLADNARLHCPDCTKPRRRSAIPAAVPDAGAARKRLYPGYRPAHLPKRHEATSIAITGVGQAADVMRAKGVPADVGDPIDAVAFFDDQSGALACLVCDYPNGRRVEYRARQRSERISYTTVEKAA